MNPEEMNPDEVEHGAKGVPIPYGRDYPDTDLWEDRDGRVYHGDDGPHRHRRWRVVCRWLASWRAKWWR